MNKIRNLLLLLTVAFLGCTVDIREKEVIIEEENYPPIIIQNNLEEAFDEAKWILYKSNYVLGNKHLCFAVLESVQNPKCNYDLLASELKNFNIDISEDTLNFRFSFGFFYNDSLLIPLDRFFCTSVSFENKISVEMGCISNSTISLATFDSSKKDASFEKYLEENENKLNPWLSNFWLKKKASRIK